ncbi:MULTISPECIES: hypothetical protein [Achromobacter]|uniref:Uncharacterized protein n=2 Tax=Achromobacter piechaudii TaxID=72556 RepID=A0A6S7BZQ1_9BURK|nr:MULTISPECIES: hypothetical protein [Achromobacter]EFF73332.1 hypothetical protein HMPREF0004_5261 [Achromobacter piechaudii ATCC 43553]KNY09571.1 hypothetical protein AKG08_14050 [Achromobacter piechaudii]MPS78434.1 hypothetical protein [Achromobacter sp.]CAB3824738.1 hypothetical protein LMG1861_00445 [Achromobacter piechaudii]CAB3911445.1 hypothetical protein LMG2828_05018 [Achromobacter piechaudii]
MKDDARSWTLSEDSVVLRFQPVFTAQGQVHEYAVMGRCRPSPWSSLNPVGLGASLIAGVSFFKKFKTPIELSFEHALDVRGHGDLAERLCTELGIGVLENAVWVNKQARYDDAAPLLMPTKRITFTLPLTDRLSDHADVLSRYPEFQARLRARLVPGTQRGKTSAHGSLRADGLHVQVPLGLSENRTLQGRFFTLMERAWCANLQVVAGGVEDIRDFAWMRLHSDLLFRGAALSAPLSAECLGIWLEADSNAWRSFSASTTRFAGVAES